MAAYHAGRTRSAGGGGWELASPLSGRRLGPKHPLQQVECRDRRITRIFDRPCVHALHIDVVKREAANPRTVQKLRIGFDRLDGDQDAAAVQKAIAAALDPIVSSRLPGVR